jgi:hypothetical protein
MPDSLPVREWCIAGPMRLAAVAVMVGSNSRTVIRTGRQVEIKPDGYCAKMRAALLVYVKKGAFHEPFLLEPQTEIASPPGWPQQDD